MAREYSRDGSKHGDGGGGSVVVGRFISGNGVAVAAAIPGHRLERDRSRLSVDPP